MNGKDFLEMLNDLDLNLVAAADRPPEPKQRWHFNWGSVVAVAMLLAVLCLPLGFSYLIDHNLIPAASGDGQGATSHQAPDEEDPDYLAEMEAARKEVEARRDAAAAKEQSRVQVWGEDWTIPDNVKDLPEGVTWSVSGVGAKDDGTPEYQWDHYTMAKEYVREKYGDSVPVEEYFKYTHGQGTRLLGEECDSDTYEAWNNAYYGGDPLYDSLYDLGEEPSFLKLPALSPPEYTIQPSLLPARVFVRIDTDGPTAGQPNRVNVYWYEKDYEATMDSNGIFELPQMISINLSRTALVDEERTGERMAFMGGETQVIFEDAQVSAYGTLNSDKVFTGWMGRDTWFRLYCSSRVPVENVQQALDWLLDHTGLLDNLYNDDPPAWSTHWVALSGAIWIDELDQFVPEELLPYVLTDTDVVPELIGEVERCATLENGRAFRVSYANHGLSEEDKRAHLIEWTLYETFDPDRPPQAYPDVPDLSDITREGVEEEWIDMHGCIYHRLAFFWDGHYITAHFDMDATADDLWAVVEALQNAAQAPAEPASSPLNR